MSGKSVICLLFPLLSLTSGLQWADSVSDGQVITSCDGYDVTFPWDFKTARDDVIFSVSWFSQGQSPELIAFFSHGTFVPVPGYNGRVEYVANGGLVLRHVTEMDRGNYSVEIDGHDGSGFSFTLTSSAVLEVSAPMKTPGFSLPMTQSPRAVHDDVTDTWSLQLSCGNFSYTGQPPFAVEWATPSGSVHNSTSYKDGQFHLLLPSPIEKGAYTCSIPPRFASQACLPHNLTAAHNTSAPVDNTEARLALLEAQQDYLRQENSLLKEENHELKQRVENVETCTGCSEGSNRSFANGAVSLQAIQNLTLSMDAQAKDVNRLSKLVDDQAQDAQNLTQAVNSLERDRLQSSAALVAVQHTLQQLESSVVQNNLSVENLAKEMHMLETAIVRDKATMTQSLDSVKRQLVQRQVDSPQSPSTNKGDYTKVSFHAQLATNTMVSAAKTLVLTRVYNNDGSAYDETTGVFTAPRAGTYFFIASTGSHSVDQDAYLELIVDDQQLATAYAHRSNMSSEMATCHGVAALTTGQHVWLKSMLDSYFNYADTFFSGFLITPA